MLFCIPVIPPATSRPATQLQCNPPFPKPRCPDRTRVPPTLVAFLHLYLRERRAAHGSFRRRLIAVESTPFYLREVALLKKIEQSRRIFEYLYIRVSSCSSDVEINTMRRMRSIRCHHEHPPSLSRPTRPIHLHSVDSAERAQETRLEQPRHLRHSESGLR